MATTKATDPAFSKEPDILSGTYEDVNGVGKDITLNFQYPENGDSSIKEPLNKREYIATELLSKMVVSEKFTSQSPEQLAHHAILHTDALITQLNNTPIP